MAALKGYKVRIVQPIIAEYEVFATDSDLAAKASIVAFSGQRGIHLPDPIVEVLDA